MTSPETVIRRYLDDHGGRVEAHIKHLTDSWELQEVGEEDLEAIRGALAGVGVQTDPPLPNLASDGRVTLYIAEHPGDGAGRAESNGDREQPTFERKRKEPRHGTRRQSRAQVIRGITARVRGSAASEARVETETQAEAEAAPDARDASVQDAEAEPAATGDGHAVEEVVDGQVVEEVGDGQAVEEVADDGVEEVVDDGRAVEEVADDGPTVEEVADDGPTVEEVADDGPAVEEVVDGRAVEGAADDGAGEVPAPGSPAVAELLEELFGEEQQRRLEERLEQLTGSRAALQDRLEEIRDALEGVDAVARRRISEIEQATGQPEEGSEEARARLADLQQRLHSLRVAEDGTESTAAERETLARAVLEPERHERLEALFQTLVESEAAAQQARERREADTAQLEAALREAQDAIATARAAADETLANPELRSELEARLETLAECERREGELRARRDEEARRWTGELSDLRRRSVEARDALRGELFDPEHRSESEQRLAALIKAEDDARQVLSQRVQHALADAEQGLSGAREELDREQERTFSAAGRLDALLAADRETADAIARERSQTEAIQADLERWTAEIQAGLARAAMGPERRSEVQARLQSFVESREREHAAALAAAQAAHRSELAETERQLGAARSELERVKLEAEEWLRGVRDRLSESQAELARARDTQAGFEARVRELAEAEANLRSELDAARAEHSEQLNQAQEQLATARAEHSELEQSTAELQRRFEEADAEAQRQLAQARAELPRQLEQARAEAQQELEQARAEAQQELEQAKAEAQQELEETKADAQRQREEAESRLEAARSEIETWLQELEQVKQRADEQLATTHRQLKHVETTLGRERQERAELEERFTALRHEEAQLRETLDATLSSQSKLEASAVEHARKHERIQEHLTARQAELEEAQAEHTRRLEEARAAHERQLEATRTEHARELDEANARLVETARRAESAAEQQRQELERAHTEREEATARLAALENELEDLRARRAGSRARLGEALGPVEQARQELETARADVSLARGEVERLLEAVADAEGRLEEKQREVAEAQSRYADESRRREEHEQHASALQDARNEHERETEDRRATLARLEDELATSLATIQRGVGEADDQGQRVTQIQRAAASALFQDAKEAAALEQQLVEAIDREQGTRRAVEREEAKVRELRDEIAAVERLIGESEAATAEAGQKLEAESAELAKIDAGLPAVVEAESRATEAAEALLAEVKGLHDRLRDAEETVEQRLGQVQERVAALADVQNDLQEEVSRQATEARG